MDSAVLCVPTGQHINGGNMFYALCSFLRDSQHQTVQLRAPSSRDLPDRSNCVTERSRGLRAPRGKRSPSSAPPLSHRRVKAQTSVAAGYTTYSSGCTEGRPRAATGLGVGSRKPSLTRPAINHKVTICSCSPEYDRRNNNA